MYIIQVKDKYGSSRLLVSHFIPETEYTNGNSFDREDARRLKNLLQKYSTSVIYRVKKIK